MLTWRYYEIIRKKVELSLTWSKESQHCLVNAGTRTYLIVIEGVPLLLADINRSIYGTCDKIGGSKPQLRHKQVGRTITPVVLDVRKLKQKSLVIKFLNLMNMQIRTFDVERSKGHDFDELSRSVYIFAQRNFYTMWNLITQRVNDASIVRFGALSHTKKRCRFRATFCQVKYGVLKVLIILSTKRSSNFPKIT